MKRQRPQWQSVCTLLAPVIWGIVMSVSVVAYEGDLGRNLGDLTVPPVLQPIPPPNEDDVTPTPTNVPTIVDGGCSTGQNGNGCAPVVPPAASPVFDATYYPSVDDFFTPQPSQVPGDGEPTNVPPSEPTEATPQPVQNPEPSLPETPETPQPVESQNPEEPTPQPVESQNPEPSLPETSETPQPVDVEPPFPLEPQTPQPSEPQTPAPIQTTEPPIATPIPTTPAPITKPTPFQLTGPPTSRTIEVPIEPFVLSLGFNEPQTGTAMDLEILTSEIERIVGDHLFETLTIQNTHENVVLEAVQLIGTRELRRRVDNNDNVFEGKRRLRALQTQVVKFQIAGNAVYDVGEGANVTPEQLEQDTNRVVATTMSDPESLDEITRQFQQSTESDALSNTTSVTAEVQAPPDNNGRDKPTTVATVFGFILAGLGAIGLCMYAWAFFKKRRKKRLQRKRERERGLGDSFNNTRMNTTASMGSSINRSRSSPASKMMVLPPTEFEDESSSEANSSPAVSVADESSSAVPSEPEASGSVSSASDPYAGIASDTSSKSDFTRELELAASLDRRSWIETQQQRSAMDEDIRDRASIQYPSQYEVEEIETQHLSGDRGAAIGIATAGAAVAAAAVAVKSYPYGDEDSDKMPVDLSQEHASDGDDVFSESDEGVEWTEEGVWSPYDGYTQRKIPAGEASRGSISTMTGTRNTDSRSSERQSGRPSWMKSWSSIDSFRDRRKAAKDPIDADREADSRRTLLGSLAEDSEIEEEELFVRAAARAVEIETLETNAANEAARVSPPTVSISSAGTSNAVRMSPTTSAAATEVVLSKKAVVEENEDDADSVLTEDIVKEVSRLARFVKKYDRKREKKLLKDRERSEKAALATKDSQSHPSTSIGYDAMSDSVSALQKGRVDFSPRRERAALSKPVEESDESDSSERSWSTTSNANRAFDDDEESEPVVDDSEIDVSDESDLDENVSESASDLSRLGITPYSIQRVVGRPKNANPAKRSIISDASAPETSRPPAAGRHGKSRGLPPMSSTPGSPDEDSPEKTPTPLKNMKKSMGRSSYSQRNEQAPPTDQSSSKGLSEEALYKLADGDGPAGVTSPYEQPKGALAVLRKNEAILDTASSHITDGVTSSQYEQAIHVGLARQEEQRRAYLARNSFAKQAHHRIPRDPPAQTSRSASVQASVQTSDEKRSPPGWEATDPSVDEARVPPAQSSPKEELRKQRAARESATEERVPWSKPTAAPPQTAPEPRTSSSQSPRRWKPPQKINAQPAAAPPTAFASQSGTKRAAPQTQTAQETAPAQISPSMKSPPRRKSKSGSAFNNVISMFEQKPKNPIYPATDGWQYNGASR